jgi:glycosyltransferase involved in cell wall biosynthesis
MASTLLRTRRNAAKAKATTRTPEAELRVLIIQHKGDSSEAKVVSALLAAMQNSTHVRGASAIMVVQFGHERLSYGESLHGIPGVEVMSLDIGGSLGVKQPRQHAAVYLSRLVLSLPRILARIRRFRPHVIYSSQQRWDVRLAMIVASTLRRPHVIHLHYLPGPWLGKDITWQLRRCPQVICVSEFLRNKAIEAGIPADRIVVIRNVLPPDAIETGMTRDEAREELCNALHISTTDVLVGMVARLAPGKGQRELVHAMAPLLTQKEANCQLILVGSETYPELGYAQQMLDSVESTGIASRVHWMGERSDVPTLLRAFDVFAHPSFDEPLGLSVLEALLAGLPCVVWRDGGPAELVVDGETGLLAETGDIQALTSAIRTLCENPLLRERMGNAALANTAHLVDTRTAARALRRVLGSVASLRQ